LTMMIEWRPDPSGDDDEVNPAVKPSPLNSKEGI
jgi:hypothetical protein